MAIRARINYMKKLQRLIWQLQIPMILIVPLWLIVGRALLGSAGWITVILLITVVPALLVMMTILTILILVRRDVRANHIVSPLDAKLGAIFYAATLLFGVFLVDGGDTEDSVGSVASHLFGRWFVEVSSIIAMILGVIATVALLAALIYAVIEMVRSRRQPIADGETIRPVVSGNSTSNKV
jgi:hypothetical protein